MGSTLKINISEVVVVAMQVDRSSSGVLCDHKHIDRRPSTHRYQEL